MKVLSGLASAVLAQQVKNFNFSFVTVLSVIQLMKQNVSFNQVLVEKSHSLSLIVVMLS